MSPCRRIRVHPHRDGPWLVVLGRRRLAVPAGVGERLQDLDGCRLADQELARRLGCDPQVARTLLLDEPPRARRTRPWLRAPLIPEEQVNRAAATLRPLTGGRALAVLAAGGLLLTAAGDPAAAAAASVGSRVAALPLLVASGLVHELGHAAALLRAGYPPGRIGVGMLAVLPVLWCDVSAVGMLAKRERVRVDLAGPILQLAVAGLCSAVGRLMSGPAAAVCATVAAWAFLATGWSLTPFFRADGFWVLTDLVGLDDLDRPPRRGDPRRTLLLLAAYRLAHAIFFGALAAAALRRADPQTGAGGLALGVGLALAGMVVLRVARFVRPLVRQFP